MTTTGIDKRTKVESAVRQLNDDLSTNTLSDTRRRATLEQLKVWGRDPSGADAIYCAAGLTTFTSYAFGSYSSDVVQEALRVIANALLLHPILQTTFLEVDGLAKVTKLYGNQDDDFEFLGARILFLCTYGAKADFASSFSANLIQNIEDHIARHASEFVSGRSTSTPIKLMAVGETAKLIFNLNDKYPEECKTLNASVPDLCTILQACEINTAPLDAPIGPILNALACLDFGAVPAKADEQKTPNRSEGLLAALIHIVDRSIQYYKPIQLDTLAISILTVLRMLYDTSSSTAQAGMREKLLPADSERDLPLGQSSSLASRLLRLTTTPGLSNIPEAISSLMFEMSDKNATKFVKNIGYGYAAGYLMTHNIPVPESVKEGVTVQSSTDHVPINPITGQRLDRESVPDLPEMTEEEKEREAERLFVLFERLRATGVVSADNPVRQAMQEGKLEEVSDSDPD